MPTKFTFHESPRESTTPRLSELVASSSDEFSANSVTDLSDVTPARAQGKYGGLGARPDAPLHPQLPPVVQRAYPKSANFALAKLESVSQSEVPQSARAANSRSWSASGGVRDATFRKQRLGAPKNALDTNPVGFSVVLGAADDMGASMADDEASAIALCLEQMLVKVEDLNMACSSTQKSGKSPSLNAAATSAAGARCGDRSSDSSRSVDLEALTRGSGGASREEWVAASALARAAPQVLRMGTVLGVAEAADALAIALDAGKLSEADLRASGGDAGDAAEQASSQAASDHPASCSASGAGTAAGGKASRATGPYGKLVGHNHRGDEREAKLPSWSESGGMREGGFKKKSSGGFN